MSQILEDFIRKSLYLAIYAFLASLAGVALILSGVSEVLAALLIAPIMLAAGYYIVGGMKHLRATLRQHEHEVAEDIKASYSRHQAVLEHMTQGLILTDLSDTIDYINSYGTKLTGFTLDDLHGKRIYDTLLLADEREAMRRRTRETATGKNNDYDLHIQRKNGKMAWLRVNSSPLRDDKGKVLGAIHNLTDITEQKQALDALAKSDKNLRAILDNIPLVLFMLDTDGIFTLSEGLGLNALQRYAGEVVGQSVFDVYADVPEVVADAERALKGEAFQSITNLDDKVFETFYSPLYDENGTMNSVIGVAVDISKRVSVEKDLRLRTQAIEYSATGITIADATQPDMPIIYANRAMLDITGYTLDEVLGRNCRFLQGDDRDQPEIDIIRHAINHNEACTLVLRNYRKNGEMFYNELGITPVANEHGQVTHFAGVMNDVTERIRTQVNLAEARDQALEASRLKSEFLATMSHEIRTPMNGIIGMTELLIDSNLTAEQREFSKIVFDEAHHLLNIINTILDFSRIEANKLILHEEVINLHDIIDGIGEAYASVARSKSIALYIEILPEVPVYVLGDALRVRQVVANLVDNALKFTHEGEVIVQMGIDETTQSDTNHAQIQIKVIDTGIGMAEDGLEHLFEPFTQADGSTTRRYGGTGLGLTISKRLTEMMSGKITLVSEENKGSTFSVHIPFKLPAPTGDFASQPRSLQGMTQASLFEELYVLVMSSSVTKSDIIKRQLLNWGIQEEHITAVRTMRAATRVIADSSATQPYAVAIVDVLANNIKDKDFIDGYQSLLATSNLAVITIADVTNETIRKLSGSDDTMQVVNKPMKSGQLYRAMQAVLDHPAEEQTPAQIDAPPRQTHKRVLVVEDNPLNREVTERQLEHLGYSASSAENGKDALAVLAKDSDFDLVLMDCQMPEMDGFEATHRIRKEEKNNGHHLTIVAMTANAMQGDREKCIAAGMDDYISKPVKIDVLRGILEKWIADLNLSSD